MAILPESPKPPPKTTTTTNPIHFWFHFIVLASLVTLIFITLTYFYPQDPKTWFINLPTPLRQHYSRGSILKVQLAPNQPQVGVFFIQQGPRESQEKTLFIHGLGCSSFAFWEVVKFLGGKSVHAVAIDLPGSGFSDKVVSVVEDVGESYGVLGRVWEIYEEIKEKGMFSGFDELIENGYVDQERKVRVSRRERVRSIELGSEEMGRVLGQVIDGMRLGPVDLVLHDSAMMLSANWISKNLEFVRSVVILDGGNDRPALPLWALEMLGVREIVLGSRFAFERVISAYCVKSGGGVDVETHRILLKGREGRNAIVGMAKKLNSSFDIAEWAALDGVKSFPMQVIWSTGCSQEWSDQGRQIAKALPQAVFDTHTGGRWPQEHNAIEIAEKVHQFISSLPKSNKQAEEEAIPEHRHTLLDEARNNGHDHPHHHHDHHGHAHPGYMDSYGFGQGREA
ncbi:hydrolase [Lithospermum erythrorhizon]|uniref:Hydrolase n=1 Tax=Lithospermum erythrorhizon TaxID=34254 RepID=A0AAV3R643_LITER